MGYMIIDISSGDTKESAVSEPQENNNVTRIQIIEENPETGLEESIPNGDKIKQGQDDEAIIRNSVQEEIRKSTAL
jgi:hypothetical protein